MDLKSAFRLQAEVTCSICTELFREPVTIDCGHNFCSCCLTQYMSANDLEISCPECKQSFNYMNLKPNKQLANIVEILQQTKIQSEEVSPHSLCPEHKEKLQLFCDTYGIPICLVCKESNTHNDHKERPIKEAEDEYRDKVQGCLSNLREVREGILDKKRQDEDAFERLRTQLENEKKNVTSYISELHMRLREREKEFIDELKIEQKISVAELAHPDKSSSQILEVNALMTEIQNMFKESALELLVTQLRNEMENFFSHFSELHLRLREREKSVLDDLLKMEQKVAVAGSTHKEKHSSQISVVNTVINEIQEMFKKPSMEFLENARSSLSKYESTMFSGNQHLNQNHQVKVVLDPYTVSKWLILSEDGRRATWTEEPQSLPDHPKRFVASECVLGTEGFTSGRHYWEMHFLTEGPGWSVGVAGQSVNRQSEIRELPDMGIWAVGKWDSQFKALTPSRTLLFLHQEPQKIVVYLDYEAGRLSLFNKDTTEHLYTFTDADFSAVVYPYFKLWKTDLRLL